MSLQLSIVLGYFLLVTPIGLITMRLNRSADDFLLAGRNMGVLLCSAAIAGEWIGGTATIGTAEGGYLYGISAGWFTLANAIGTVVLAFTLAKLYRRTGSFTVTGFMERYFGSRCRTVSAIILTFVMILVTSVQIVAGAALINTLTGLDPRWAMVITGFVFLAYTLCGGLWAIGITNSIHLVVMYVGIFVGLILVWKSAGGLPALTSTLPSAPYFHPFGGGVSQVIAWIIASTLAALVAQAAVQPVMAARDEETAKKGALLAVVYIVPVGIVTTLMGMFARVLYPNISARLALPTLLLGLPAWASGLVLAGILAAILSTVAPCILAAGTLLAKDLYASVIKPRANDQEVNRFSKLATLVSGVIAIILAMYSTDTILGQIYFAYTLRASLAILVLLGVYWSPARKGPAVLAIVVTSIVAIGWEIYKGATGAYPAGVHPMYMALLVTCAVMIAGSCRRNPHAPDLET